VKVLKIKTRVITRGKLQVRLGVILLAGVIPVAASADVYRIK
jgi:hypothetical protein